jgi:hypothetical protein
MLVCMVGKKIGREEERVFAISSACRRPRRIAATDGLFPLQFFDLTNDVNPSNHGGVGKIEAGY